MKNDRYAFVYITKQANKAPLAQSHESKAFLMF